MGITRFLVLLVPVLFSLLAANAQPCAYSSGPLTGSSFTTGALGGSSAGWSNPGNAQTLDGNYATSNISLGGLGATAYSDYLEVTGFGFNIPASATICGIEVDVQRSVSTFLGLGGFTDDKSIQVLKGGSLTPSNLASGSHWPGSVADAVYGGSGVLWGSSWFPADINNAGFGVAISAFMHSGVASVGMTANIDQVSITVTYDISTLGLSLQHFSVTRQTGGNLLSWTTSAGGQDDQFTVQRSADGKSWQSLSVIQSGNSGGGEAMDYTYMDGTPLNGSSLYRLSLRDAGGGISYSNTIGITGNKGNNSAIRCYPNPVSDMIHISSPGNIGSVRLTDIQGRVLCVQEPHAATYEWQLPASGLPPGLYLLQVDDAVFRLVKK